MNILHIDSSPLGERSVSRRLTAKLVADWQRKHPGSKVVRRDVGTASLPHLDGLTISAFFAPPDQRTPAQAEAVKLSDIAVAELIAADVVIIGAPMWNFNIPSALKAWIDHVVRAGHTFRYGAKGPEGMLHASKKVVVAVARGGIYSEGPFKPYDFQETYLKGIFGFLGLTDVSFIRAEGLAMGDEAAKSSIKSAEEAADKLAAAA